MRFALLLFVASCTGAGLDEDHTYRRLVDQFDSYEQCIADDAIVSCYQTLVLCANGRVMMDLDNRPKDGHYQLEGSVATAQVAGERIVFDLDSRTSRQLPGRHPWEVATPSFTGCDVE